MKFPAFNSSDENVQWQRFCALNWFSDQLGMWLDISRMKINQKEIEDLRPNLEKALDAMADIERGAYANIDENRQVGHYWLRSPDLAVNQDIKNLIEKEIVEIENFSNSVLLGTIRSNNNKKFDNVIWIGIGGSALGPQLVYRSLKQQNLGLEFHFVDNIDPIGIKETIETVGENITNSLIVVVSKSGSTPEPRIVMEQFKNHLSQKGLNWPSQAVAITTRGSKLDMLAKDEQWLKRFDLPDWVGGRTSITSAVGILPIALVGKDIRNFLKGASDMDLTTRERNLQNNPAMLISAAWYSAGQGKGKKDLVVLPYRDRLDLISKYLQQLIMESLGKRLNRNGECVNQGLSVFGNKGSTDQHAYVQQLRDGIDNFFVTFIEVLGDNVNLPTISDQNPNDYLFGFLQGTRNALTDSNRQSILLTINTLNENSLGSIIALFERTVGIYAELININAYDQPGVEAGKVAASEILDLKNRVVEILADGKPRTTEEIAHLLGSSCIESIYLILRLLTFNNSNIKAIGSWREPKLIRFGLE